MSTITRRHVVAPANQPGDANLVYTELRKAPTVQRAITSGIFLRLAFILPMVICSGILAADWVLTGSDGPRQLATGWRFSKGVPLEEKAYDGACTIKDLRDKVLDPFFPAHLIGWMVTSMMARAWKETTLISAVDELCEVWWRSSYNNFKECWWDSLILDMVLSNALGSILGAWIMKRFFGQSRNYWSHFSKDSRRRGFFYLINLIAFKVLSFFLLFGFKSVLWITPNHWINIYRMLAYAVLSEAALSETWNNVTTGRGGLRHHVWSLLTWTAMLVDSVLIFGMGYHVPIWANTSDLGRSFFWVGALVGLSSFTAFFK